jgi:hypothetical protein
MDWATTKSKAGLALAFAVLIPTLLACGPSLATPTARSEPPTATVAPATPTATPEPPTSTTEPESTLIPIDDIWSEYVDERLGFAIGVPHTAWWYGGDCAWNEADGDHSYRPVWAELPLVIIEDVDRVYISAASHVEFTQPTEEAFGGGTRTYFAGCDRIPTTLEWVLNRQITSGTWEIVAREVEDEAGLEALIDEVYGEACRLGEVIETETPGIYRVRVLGDGLPPEETNCWVNYMYVFRYSPELRRAVTWITGQSTYFVADPETAEGYDRAMTESFRFLP